MHRLLRTCQHLFLTLWLLPAAAVAADFTAPYGTLLASYVSDGQKDGITATLVNYKAWSEDKHHQKAINQLMEAQPAKLSGTAATAFWINAYNLLVIELIIQNQQKESIRNVGTVLDDPWKSFGWMIGGKSYTLKAIEQEATASKDPRIYFALANGTLSGPDLSMEIYTADKLEAQLDMQTMVFLKNETKGLKLFGTILQVSKIFQQHARVFEAGGGREEFVRARIPELPASAAIQGFFDYNWSLNGSWE